MIVQGAGHRSDRAPSFEKICFLVLHGAEDKPYPLQKVAAEVYDELRSAYVEFQMEFYSGAGHGFSVPRNKAEERANAQSRLLAGVAQTENVGDHVGELLLREDDVWHSLDLMWSEQCHP